MKSSKLVAVGVCGMIVVGLTNGVSAAEETASNNNVPVSYDYSGTATPVDPKYGVSIPTGLVFTASNATEPLDISVSLKPGQGETELSGPCSAKVSVQSSNEYTVKLADGKDAVSYVVKYGNTNLTGATATEIGTLSVGVGDSDTLTLVGSAKLDGVATMTGAHTDTLVYTITNVTVQP